MAAHLPTPSPSPPSIVNQIAPLPVTLSTQINVATRKRHTQLNRLIAERLPLALPPYTSDPKVLYRGLALFANIYTAFEFAWHEVTHPDLYPYLDTPRSSHDKEVLQWLANLRPNGLERAPRLMRDMEHLATITGIDYDESGVPKGDIIASIQAKPHIGIAYAWVMYMAIFSGGRWIRQQFAAAESKFWMGDHDGVDLPEKEDHALLLRLPGFTFLSFDSDTDGEDIKAEFKSRLAQADDLLTPQEKQEVVDTADELFGLCIELVGELDRRVWWSRVARLIPSVLIVVLVLIGLVILYWIDNYGYL